MIFLQTHRIVMAPFKLTFFFLLGPREKQSSQPSSMGEPAIDRDSGLSGAPPCRLRGRPLPPLHGRPLPQLWQRLRPLWRRPLPPLRSSSTSSSRSLSCISTSRGRRRRQAAPTSGPRCGRSSGGSSGARPCPAIPGVGAAPAGAPAAGVATTASCEPRGCHG